MAAKVAVLTTAVGLALIAALAPPAAADLSSQYVRTESGRVRCLINSVTARFHPDMVICEASGLPLSAGGDNDGFLQAPMASYGSHYHNAVVDASGTFSFQDGGNIGGAGEHNDTLLRYGQKYSINGWNIEPNRDGTRFTNERTGHGMFVSIENVYSF